MNYKMIGRILSWILLLEAAFMTPALVISACLGELEAVHAFALSMGLTLAAALVLYMVGRRARMGLFARDGLVCVGMGWIVMSIFGGLPFWLSGAIPSFVDALFEIVSGFTTTGASILTDVEVVPRGLLYWRSFSHWLGGMGVLVFLLAVLPLSGRNRGFTMHLLRAESPGPDVGKLVPKMRQTALILYVLYILLTVLNVGFLLAGGMSLFDAVCTAFGTAGTGGFGVRNDSIAGYSPYLQNVCTIFMFLFGVNFNIYYLLVMRKFGAVARDDELRLYVGVALVSAALITLDIRDMYSTWSESIRHATFQVSSIMTTTGFATTDFDLWPSFSKSILLVLMVIGASAGSTGGGIKVSRILLLAKTAKQEIVKMLNPRRTSAVRMDGHTVEITTIRAALVFFTLYITITFISTVIVALDGFDLVTTFTSVVTCISNVGPGLGEVGPMGNFSAFSDISKLILSADMLLGRLEIFPILILFTPSTWRKK